MPYGPQVLWPVHCVQGTPGADFHPDLETDAADLVVRKGFRPEIDSYSAFFENDHRTPTGLAGYLRDRGVRRCGSPGSPPTSASPGRRSTPLGHDFEVTLLEDACRAIDLDGSLAAAMRQMRTGGVVIAPRGGPRP